MWEQLPFQIVKQRDYSLLASVPSVSRWLTSEEHSMLSI